MLNEAFISRCNAGKWGSVFTVSIMMVGCILLTLTGIGLSGRQMTIWYIIAQVYLAPIPALSMKPYNQILDATHLGNIHTSMIIFR